MNGRGRKMRRENRKILLSLDSANSHLDLQIENVTIIYLPAIWTSVLKPKDQGVIQTLKLSFTPVYIDSGKQYCWWLRTAQRSDCS